MNADRNEDLENDVTSESSKTVQLSSDDMSSLIANDAPRVYQRYRLLQWCAREFGRFFNPVTGETPGSSVEVSHNSEFLRPIVLPIVRFWGIFPRLNSWFSQTRNASCPFASTVLAAVALLLGSPAAAQSGPFGACTPVFQSFAGGGDVDGPVRASAQFQIDGVSHLFVGGSFQNAGGYASPGISAFNGMSWLAVPNPAFGTAATAMIAADPDGPGPIPFSVVAAFPFAGVCAAWDGTTWRTLPAVIASGFELLGQAPATTLIAATPSGVLQLQGGAWSPLPSSGAVVCEIANAVLVFAEADGPVLYAAGSFHQGAGPSGYGVGRWTAGAGWQMSATTDGEVIALAKFHDGAAERVVASGAFTRMNGVPTTRLASLVNGSWQTLAGGLINGGSAPALAVLGSGPTNTLYVGGSVLQARNGMTSIGGSALALQNGLWTALAPLTPGAVTYLASTNINFTENLIASGTFNTPARLVRRTGISGAWLNVTPGPGGPVLALANPAGTDEVWFAGTFTTIAGLPAARVGKWDGLRFAPVGQQISEDIYSLAQANAGTGPQMFAGGTHLWRFNGASWNDLGGLGNINVLREFDDGTGPSLLVAGNFATAGVPNTANVALYRNGQFRAMDTGLSGAVRDAIVFDDGSGPALYAAGGITGTGGLAAPVGASSFGADGWRSHSGGPYSSIPAFQMLTGNVGQGSRIYATTGQIVEWTGSQWQRMGTLGPVMSACIHPVANVPTLIAGGEFNTTNGNSVEYVARWSGTTWQQVGTGLTRAVRSVVSFNNGLETKLYAAGQNIIGSGTSPGLAVLNGNTWQAVANAPTSIYSMKVVNDGVRDRLLMWTISPSVGLYELTDAGFVAFPTENLGGFANDYAFFDPDGAGPMPARLYALAGSQFMRLDGSVWTMVAYFGGTPKCFAQFIPPGRTTPVLYIGGSMDNMYTAALPGVRFNASRLVGWDGTQMVVDDGVNGEVYAICAGDLGDGPRLFIAGIYSLAKYRILGAVVKWTGSRWESASVNPADPNNSVLCLGEYRGELYVGGGFSTFDSNPIRRIAVRRGGAWRAIDGDDSGLDGGVLSMQVVDIDGSGPGEPVLVAAGSFDRPVRGGAASSFTSLKGTGAWNGQRWLPMGGITWDSSAANGIGPVHDLLVVQEPTGPTLFVGGGLLSAGTTPSRFLARWSCSAAGTPPCTADIASLGGQPGPDGLLTADDIILFLQAFFAGDVPTADIASLGGAPNPDGQITADDVIVFLGSFFAGCF